MFFIFFTEKTPKISDEVTESLQCVVVLLFLGVTTGRGCVLTGFVDIKYLPRKTKE